MSKKYKNKTNKQIDKNDQIINIINSEDSIIKDIKDTELDNTTTDCIDYMSIKEELLYDVIDSLDDRIEIIETIFEEMYSCINELLVDQHNPPLVSIMKTFRKINKIILPSIILPSNDK
jgi:hypothetical protein